MKRLADPRDELEEARLLARRPGARLRQVDRDQVGDAPRPGRHHDDSRREEDGLGGAILNFAQYYSFQPASLWATNVIAALLGIAFFLVVVAAERLVVRRAPENVA